MRETPLSPVEMDNSLRYRFGLPVRKRARTTPFGYIDLGNGWLEPKEDVFVALCKSIQYLEENCSQRATLDWLQTEAKESLNLSAFQKIVRIRPPFKSCWNKSRGERQKMYDEITSGQKISSFAETEGADEA
jgi:hypothetical protein